MPIKDPVKRREKQKEYQKKHYESKKKYYIDRAKVDRDKMRMIVAQLKQELKCEFCGEDHPSCLDFHHRDPSQKEFTIANAVTRGFGIERIKQEMAKCSVLCANCHRKLHYIEKHGGEIK